VVSARPGGSQGGGAALTAFGTTLVRDYRAIESAATTAARSRLRKLEAGLRKQKQTSAVRSRKISIRARKR